MAQDEDNLDIVTDGDINNSQRKSGRNPVSEMAKEQTKKKIIDKIAKSKFGQAVKKVFSKIAEAIAPYIMPLIVAIVIIICVIGIVAFFVNMPGLVRGKLDQMFTEALSKIDEFLYGSNVNLSGENIDKDKRKELLQYINDMGIDVVGYGFAPGVTFKEDDEGKQVIYNYTTDLMSVKDDESTSVNPRGDLIYYYLMANERAYIRNDNGVLGKLFGDGKTPWTGMIDIHDILGDSGFDGIEATVDRDNQVLKISVNNAHLGELLNEDQYSFSLEGWTGRYGIPVEFSLALHLATMSSGMVQELITNEDLQTTVTIGLQQAKKCDINFKFRVKNEDGSIKEIDIPLKAPNGETTSLTTKIQNGEEITKENLSIEGLYYAFNSLLLYDYEVVSVDYNDIDIISTYGHDLKDGVVNASRHLETIDAILGESDLAVYVADKCTESSTIDIDALNFPVIYPKPIISTRLYDINSGAYICKYKSNGEPDENTGKLKVRKFGESGESLGYLSRIDENQDTDEFYWYTYTSKNLESGAEENTENPNAWELVPKGEEAYYYNADGTKFVAYSQKIKGLKYYKDNGIKAEDLVNLARDYEAYEAMFKEIDWFISYIICQNQWDISQFNYKCENEFYKLAETGDINTVLYYTNLFQSICNEGITYDSLFGENGLYEQLEEDFEKIKELSPKTDNAKEKIQTMLESLECPNLTKEIVQKMYEMGIQSDDVNNTDIKYVQPYIMSVIKHWYKDVDFVSKAYSDSSDSIELLYTGNSGLPSNVELVTIITPIEGESLKSQTDNPYVIKGDVVLCDGKIQQDAELSNIKYVTNNSNGYQWGDGYRATKKIFTQGFYYTYDGTAETAKSIYYQQEIEDTFLNGLYKISVINGRIYSAALLTGDETVPVGGTSELKGEDIVELMQIKDSFTSMQGVEEVYNQNGVRVYFTQENDKTIYTPEEQLKIKGELIDKIKNKEDLTENDEDSTQDKDTIQGIPVKEKWYVIYVEGRGMNYLSPANDNYTYDDVKKRVEHINAVWDSVGVICHRTHLSFDNTSSDGQVMSITGLSILKNTQTEDAEYIYRDLKEMLIELGYYTEAEFDYLDTDVLTWFIPEYTPTTWPQNSGEEALDFAAILYPKEEELEEEESEEKESGEKELTEEELKQSLGLTSDKTQGFEPDLDVIAPGDCIIVNKTDEGIEIEFDGVSQPEIGVLDGYTMVIKGINTDSGITIIDEDGNETQISYEEAKKNKTVIKVGSIIGKTGTEEIKVLLMNDQGGILSNVEDYMAPDIATINSDSSEFSIVGTVLTENEFVNCCLGYINKNNIVNSDFSESNLRQFYRICKENAVNPEYAFVTAVSESSLTASEATSTHNYWGLDTPNGSSVPSLGTMLETLQIYCERLVEYQNPTSEYYSMIMNKYNERSTCTENGGCNPNGYGKPNTLQGLQSIYSYVGDHVPGSAGTGGYYYLDPDVAGFTAIYSTHAEFVSKCKNVHEQGSMASVWEQAQYTAYQVESKIERARSIFGDKAGRYML